MNKEEYLSALEKALSAGPASGNVSYAPLFVDPSKRVILLSEEDWFAVSAVLYRVGGQINDALVNTIPRFLRTKEQFLELMTTKEANHIYDSRSYIVVARGNICAIPTAIISKIFEACRDKNIGQDETAERYTRVKEKASMVMLNMVTSRRM